jgi:hypothetical protein
VFAGLHTCLVHGNTITIVQGCKGRRIASMLFSGVLVRMCLRGSPPAAFNDSEANSKDAAVYESLALATQPPPRFGL